jgi:hypothetical protein
LNAERTESDGYVSEYRYAPDEGTYDNICYPVKGFFVLIENDPYSMKLYDSEGRFLHPMERVSIMRSVANSLEGKIRFPRPFIFKYKDDAEKNSGKFPSAIVSHGDFVKISYMSGNIYKPLVEGSIESFAFQTQVPFLRTDPKNLERKAERYENNSYLLEFEDDGKGNLTLAINAKTAGNGNIKITTNGNVDLTATNVIINGGTKGVSREDDTIQATIPANTFLNVSNNPNIEMTITGKITSASATVKAGG